MIDIDIIIKPSRAWASMHANTADGRAWMAYNIVRAESVVLATFPASVADEHAAAIRRAGLKTVVWELVETRMEGRVIRFLYAPNKAPYNPSRDLGPADPPARVR